MRAPQASHSKLTTVLIRHREANSDIWLYPEIPIDEMRWFSCVTAVPVYLRGYVNDWKGGQEHRANKYLTWRTLKGASS